jgi:hypothetical protein
LAILAPDLRSAILPVLCLQEEHFLSCHISADESLQEVCSYTRFWTPLPSLMKYEIFENFSGARLKRKIFF